MTYVWRDEYPKWAIVERHWSRTCSSEQEARNDLVKLITQCRFDFAESFRTGRLEAPRDVVAGPAAGLVVIHPSNLLASVYGWETLDAASQEHALIDYVFILPAADVLGGDVNASTLAKQCEFVGRYQSNAAVGSDAEGTEAGQVFESHRRR